MSGGDARKEGLEQIDNAIEIFVNFKDDARLAEALMTKGIIFLFLFVVVAKYLTLCTACIASVYCHPFSPRNFVSTRKFETAEVIQSRNGTCKIDVRKIPRPNLPPLHQHRNSPRGQSRLQKSFRVFQRLVRHLRKCLRKETSQDGTGVSSAEGA